MDAMPKEWAVLPFTFLQMIALGTNYYIVPQLVISKVCHKKFNNTVCNQLGQSNFKSQENRVYEEAAAWNALINFAGFFPSLIIMLPLGAMADLVSKKKMLLIPAVANLLSCLINLCSSIFVTLPLGFNVLANFITCIFGEIPGLMVLSCTYAASASSYDTTLAMALVTASSDIGIGSGNLIDNYLKR